MGGADPHTAGSVPPSGACARRVVLSSFVARACPDPKSTGENMGAGRSMAIAGTDTSVVKAVATAGIALPTMSVQHDTVRLPREP